MALAPGPGPFSGHPSSREQELLKAMAQGVPQLPVFELNSVTAKFQQDALSAEEMGIPIEEIHDVRALMRHLQQLRDFFLGFRQRFLLHGESSADAVVLDSRLNLDVDLLHFAEVSQDRMDVLMDAAGQGSLGEVESSLQLPQGSRLEEGRRLLSFDCGHVEVIILLLEASADKDLADSFACHDEVVSLPLRAGAKIAVDIGDHTALMFASGSGCGSLDRGRRALMRACEQGSVKALGGSLQIPFGSHSPLHLHSDPPQDEEDARPPEKIRRWRSCCRNLAPGILLTLPESEMDVPADPPGAARSAREARNHPGRLLRERVPGKWGIADLVKAQDTKEVKSLANQLLRVTVT
ncbi:unnamed protein product, partial [Symbiodinium sp. KB8]